MYAHNECPLLNRHLGHISFYKLQVRQYSTCPVLPPRCRWTFCTYINHKRDTIFSCIIFSCLQYTYLWAHLALPFSHLVDSRRIHLTPHRVPGHFSSISHHATSPMQYDMTVSIAQASLHYTQLARSCGLSQRGVFLPQTLIGKHRILVDVQGQRILLCERVYTCTVQC